MSSASALGPKSSYQDFYTVPVEEFCRAFSNIKIPAEMRIQALYHRIFENPTERPVLFEKCLSFAPEDTGKMKQYINFIKRLANPEALLLPTEVPGMYRTELHGKTIAFFKTGRVRADIEPFIATLAEMIGLGDYILRGIPAVLNNVQIPEESDTQEPLLEVLWNDNTKRYYGEQTAKVLVGITEPAVKIFEEIDFTPFDLVAFSIICFLFRIRDVKEDGFGYPYSHTISHPVLFDIEDAFAVPDKRTPPEQLPSRIDWTFLDSHGKEANTPIAPEDLKKLKNIASKWDLEKIGEILLDRQILFADLGSEDRAVDEEFNDPSSSCVCVIKSQEPHPLHQTPRPKPGQPPHHLLNRYQRAAINEDVRKMKQLLLEWAGPLCAMGLIQAFDKRHAELVEVIRRSPSADRIVHHAHEFAGKYSPMDLAHQGLLSVADLEALSMSPPKTPHSPPKPSTRVYRSMSFPPRLEEASSQN